MYKDYISGDIDNGDTSVSSNNIKKGNNVVENKHEEISEDQTNYMYRYIIIGCITITVI